MNSMRPTKFDVLHPNLAYGSIVTSRLIIALTDDKIPMAPDTTFQYGREAPIATEPRITLKNT